MTKNDIKKGENFEVQKSVKNASFTSDLSRKSFGPELKKNAFFHSFFHYFLETQKLSKNVKKRRFLYDEATWIGLTL
jgi:hypothetical protein